jgi:hypothetical protein
MTILNKPVTRATLGTLGYSFGPDRNRRIIVTLTPGNGNDVEDLIVLRPQRTKRAEALPIEAVYRYAIQCRVNRTHLEKARAKKEKKKLQRERARIARVDKALAIPQA